MNVAAQCFDFHGLRAQNDRLIDVVEIINCCRSIYENVAKDNPNVVNPPLNIDLVLNWLLNVYDT